MKATGVVRRIDDLGRVVIPKEIRKTLRIKEGDPLEIFTDKEGNIILRKYSPIGELTEFATEYAESLNKTTGQIAIITDKDMVIAVAGCSKKDLLEQEISTELESIIDKKDEFLSYENSNESIIITRNGKEKPESTQVIVPIISNGDSIGSVILMAKEKSTKFGDVEKKLIELSSNFLGTQMEI